MEKIIKIADKSQEPDDFIRIFANLLDHLPLAFYRLLKEDENWTIDFMSTGLTKLLGFEKKFIDRLKTLDDLKADQPFYRQAPLKMSGNPAEYAFIYSMRTNTHKSTFVLDRGIYLYNQDGLIAGAIGVLFDPSLDPGLDLLELLPKTPPPSKEMIKTSCLDEIIGRSPQIKKVISRIKKIAPTYSRVLIEGESGTGKELAARAIHELSPFSKNPFIAINCGAISESLIESELFGHIKGAFSGASDSRKGYLDVADGGTLFLDEIGEMPMTMQIKLLRVLDGYGYIPVGATEIKNSKFRLICATNRNLEDAVRNGTMREDFYHRIKQLTITMPPLRDRTGDIEFLMQAFTERYLTEQHALKPGQRPVFPPQAKTRFMNYDWPGNVRELQYRITKYLSLYEIDFPQPFQNSSPQMNTKENEAILANQYFRPMPGRTFHDYERDLLLSTLESCHWNTTRAAETIGCTVRTIQRKIAKYHLK